MAGQRRKPRAAAQRKVPLADSENMCPTEQQQNNCVICFERCNPDDRVELQCNHGDIHAECMASWLKEQRSSGLRETCPVCRASVKPEFVTIVSVAGRTDPMQGKYIIIERGEISYYR